ncbi:hypothetical protein F4804DRAFT_263744 [Jackrogersella minutella]|nr:hypothetical protein F4804DRAFT_263744 [Jackrogersella minutella]
MKYTIVAMALAALASTQSLSDVPQCALPCIDSARTSSTNCSANDYACICKNKTAITAAATSCVLQDCGADIATNQVLPAVNAFCDAVESGNGGSSTSSGPTASTTASTTSTDSTSTSVSVAPTSATSSQAVMSTPDASVTSEAPTSIAASNSTASYTNRNPTAIPTAGAALTAGSLAMLAVGFFVAL